MSIENSICVMQVGGKINCPGKLILNPAANYMKPRDKKTDKFCLNNV